MRTFVCIASGSSLARDDCEAARAAESVLVVNDCWRIAPWADHLYAADAKWWRYHGDAVLAGFQGMRWTQQSIEKPQKDQTEVIARFRLMPVYGRWGEGAGVDHIVYGTQENANSGRQAINLAAMLGADRILLLGYDMRGDHWFGSHPPELACGPDYGAYANGFESAAKALNERGIEIINCSRETALTCFPRAPLAEALRVPEDHHRAIV